MKILVHVCSQSSHVFPESAFFRLRQADGDKDENVTVAQCNVGWNFSVLCLTYICSMFTKLQFVDFNIILFRWYDHVPLLSSQTPQRAPFRVRSQSGVIRRSS